jgi:hypothetical protein
MFETVMNIRGNYVLVSRDTVVMLNKKPPPSSLSTNFISFSASKPANPDLAKRFRKLADPDLQQHLV